VLGCLSCTREALGSSLALAKKKRKREGGKEERRKEGKRERGRKKFTWAADGRIAVKASPGLGEGER
jgi:3'-phosphoadenosine 5'-phosphosulfate sulfotransferase (PAPS reductase)/FAD synthetase